MTTFCLSHVKDIDGVSSAALVRAATGCDYRLVDYDSILEAMDAIPPGVTELFVCDLGTDQGRFDQFLTRLARLSSRAKLTYIDHHYLTEAQASSIRALPITFVHDDRECAGMLTYLHLKEALPEDAKMIALYAAVTDYMDGSSNATRLMERFDRHLVLLESTLLSYALAGSGSDSGYPRMLVEQLSAMRRPHEIDGLVEGATKQLEKVTRLAATVAKEGHSLRNLAYMKTEESSTGNVSKLLLGAFDVQVGVAYKDRDGRAEMSLRSTSECRLHLGKTIGPLATGYGGNGGGHERAAGCTLPSEYVLDLIRAIDDALSSA